MPRNLRTRSLQKLLSKEVRQEKGEEVKREIEHELWNTYTKELSPAVFERARKMVGEKALARAKDEAAQEERWCREAQIRAELTTQITARLEIDFEQRVATGARATYRIARGLQGKP